MRQRIADITGRLLAVTNGMMKACCKYRDGETFRRSMERLIAGILSSYFPEKTQSFT